MKKGILIFALSAAMVFFWNVVNLDALNAHHANVVRFGTAIYTADSPSYINPPKNFMAQGTWRDNVGGILGFYSRPPGYGLLYAAGATLFGQPHALSVLVIVQSLLCAFMVLLLYLILSMAAIPSFIKIPVLCFALFSPWLYGFPFYVLSETISGFLVVVFVYLLFLIHHQNKGAFHYLLLSAAVGVLFVTRIALMPLALLLLSFWKRASTPIRIAMLLLVLIPQLLWQARGYAVSGRFPGLHPVYSPDNDSFLRLPHQALTNLYRVWCVQTGVFHPASKSLAEAATIEERHLAVAHALSAFPAAMRQSAADSTAIYKALWQFSEAAQVSKQVTGNWLPQEIAATATINTATAQLIAHYPLRYYLFTPLQSVWHLTAQSNLNLYLFQHAWRGKLGVELFRVVCILLSLFCWLTLLLFGWRLSSSKSQTADMRLLAAGILCYLFYIAWIHRLSPPRYVQPLLIPLLIFGCVALRSYLLPAATMVAAKMKTGFRRKAAKPR